MAQARALGDPTRHAVFRHVADAPEPLGIAELTERFPFHHNAIRQHLAKLVAAGLVREQRAPRQGPGRPRHVYVVDPAVAGRWGTTGPYERLSRLLVEMLRTGDDARTVGRRAAEAEADAGAADPGGVVELTAAMARQGFAPEVVEGRQGEEIVLHHCPFETAALDDRATICALHLGLAEGLVDPGRVTVTELVTHDPRRARCRLRLGPPDPHPAAGPEPVLSLRAAPAAPRSPRPGGPS